MSLFYLILSIARTHLDLHQIATRSMIQRSSCDEVKSERLNQLLSASWGAVAMAQNFANRLKGFRSEKLGCIGGKVDSGVRYFIKNAG